MLHITQTHLHIHSRIFTLSTNWFKVSCDLILIIPMTDKCTISKFKLSHFQTHSSACSICWNQKVKTSLNWGFESMAILYVKLKCYYLINYIPWTNFNINTLHNLTYRLNRILLHMPQLHFFMINNCRNTVFHKGHVNFFSSNDQQYVILLYCSGVAKP